MVAFRQASIHEEQDNSSLRAVPGRTRKLQFAVKFVSSIYRPLLLVFAHESYSLLPYTTNGCWEGEQLLLFKLNISMCVSLCPWKMWSQGLGGSLARLTRWLTPTEDTYFQTRCPAVPCELWFFAPTLRSPNY